MNSEGRLQAGVGPHFFKSVYSHHYVQSFSCIRGMWTHTHTRLVNIKMKLKQTEEKTKDKIIGRRNGFHPTTSTFLFDSLLQDGRWLGSLNELKLTRWAEEWGLPNKSRLSEIR